MGTSGASGAPLSPAEARRWTRVGTLCALSLLLGYLESFVPIPIPGVKLGLANIPVLVALRDRDLRGACWVAATKVLATGLLFGNPLTLAYSAAGTALALAAMCPLSLVPTMRIEMVSVVGALAHEAGQLAVAQVVLGTPLVWYGAPVLAACGCMTGLLCGVVAQRTAVLLDEGEAAAAGEGGAADTPEGGAARADEDADAPVWPALLRLGMYLAFVVAAMHAKGVAALAAYFAASLAAAVVARVDARTLGRSLAATLPLAAIALVAQVASMQQGSVVCALGPVALTREALAASARMAVRLVAITAASLSVVAGTGRRGLARAAGALVAPLEAHGLDLRGPRLALSTTLRLLPALADLVGRDVRPRDLWSHAFWTGRLPALIQDLYRQAL